MLLTEYDEVEQMELFKEEGCDEAAWKEKIASPEAAAEAGEIDDVIAPSELRCRVASALLMLSAKGTVDAPARAIRPL